MNRDELDEDQTQHLESLRNLGVLATVREAIDELQRRNQRPEDEQHRQELAHILMNTIPIENMVRKVQERRLNVVLPNTVCTPAMLAKFREEREAIFKIIDRITQDVRELIVQEQKKVTEMEKNAPNEKGKTSEAESSEKTLE